MEFSPTQLVDLQHIQWTLRADYLEELPLRLERIESQIQRLQEGDEKEAFEELYRQIHSLKGSAATLGITVLVAICNPFEDLLSAAADRNRDGAFFGGCWMYLDLLREVSRQLGEGREEFGKLEGAVRELRASLTKEPFSVLVVEGSRLHQCLCAQALTDLPVAAIFEEDAYLALSRLLTERFDLLITGRQTRSLNGAALIAALRLAEGVNRDIRTLMITSNTAPLQTPFPPDAIVAKGANLVTELQRAAARLLGLS